MKRTVHIRYVGATAIRVAAAGGAVFFALLLTYASLTSGSPSATDPRREIFTYVVGHDDRLQLAAVALGLAMAAALVALSGLVRALTKAEGGTPGIALVALGGGVLAASSTVVAALLQGATAANITDIGAGGVRVWWSMSFMSFGGTLLGLLLLIGATAVVCLEHELFPRWFAVTSVVLAALSLVGAGTIGSDSTWIQAVAGVALILDSVWIFLMSVFLWRNPSLALR